MALSYLRTSNPIMKPLKPVNGLASFIVPARALRSSLEYSQVRACVIIPTYAPDTVTKQLVEDILTWNPDILVCVVDDSTPPEHAESAAILSAMIGTPRV